jgi:uncharacterized protein
VLLRSTCDTNVLAAGLNFPGVAYRVLEAAREGQFAMQLSKPILDETVRILQERFYWDEAKARGAGALLSSFSQLVAPHVELDVVKRDPDDNRVLECAQASGSDYLVTWDKDLLSLTRYAGTDIIEPQHFLAIVQGRRR